jgi:hypothetical protein
MQMPMAPTSNHGFSLLGKKSLVLSHIPMFMAPHQAQMFLEVTLAGSAGQDPTKIYLDDMAASGTTDYVLVSDPLVLPTLAPNAPDRLQSFTGTLYRGWPFNSPNTAPLLAQNVTVHVTRSLYFQGITNVPVLTELTYLAFRTEETSYLVHKLVQPPDLASAPTPPDFVQILSGKAGGVSGPHVVEVAFPGVANNFAQKLNAAQNLTGEVCGKHEPVQTVAELIYDPNHLT